MTQFSVSTSNSGLKVFSACLLSSLLILMPFVQFAPASRRGTGAVSREAERGSRPTMREGAGANSETAPLLTRGLLPAPVPEPAPEPPALAAAPFWVASTLSAGDAVIIGYNTGQTDGNGTTIDSLEFVILAPVGSGTVIRFTDRSWVPTPGNNNLNAGSFTNAANDGSFSFTAGTDLAAGTVISITFSGGNASITVNGVTTVVSAGGFNPEQNGDTIYVYQGTDANTPTGFLSAIEIGDGNTTFQGSLVNTGLVNGVTAVSTALDSATYHGPTTEAFAHFYNNERLLENIMDSSNWVGDDADGQKALDQPNHSGPYNVAPNLSLWVAGQGGGNGLIHVGADPTVSSGQTGYNLTQLYTNLLNNLSQPILAGARDVAFDTVDGKFFVAEGTRILQGNISDLLGNPSTAVNLTVLYTSTVDGTGANVGENLINNLEVDTINNIIYFSHGDRLEKIGYNTVGQTSTILADLGVGNPNGNARNFIDDFLIHFASGNVYLTSHRIISGQDGDQLSKNYIYRITGLDPADGTNAFTFANGSITVLPFSPDDDDVNNGFTWVPGEGFPQEEGTLEGIAISPDGNTLYFTAASTLYDHDADGGFSGPGGFGTPPQLIMGGVFSYSLVGNPNGNYTQIWQQLDDGDTNSQAISHTFGPQGLLDDIEFDPVTGHLYFLDQTGDQLGAVNPPGDEGIWRIAPNGTGLTYFANINNINSMGPSSIWLNHAPTVSSSTQATPGVTEASSAPGSGNTALVQPFLSLDVTDHESAGHPTQQLAGATVWMSNNFQSGATHQDTLTINGTQSGTVNGITYSYNAATGAMTLTGITTFNNYEATIALVRFNTSGDNPTAFGTATSRTVSWAVSEGLNHSDPVSTTLTVTGINDAPVNNGMTGTFSGGAFVEDAIIGAALTGITISDVDADPASQNLVMTFSVAHGTLTFLTNVVGGIVPGDITGGANGSSTVTITATQNKINATLGAANGLTYIPTTNFNGNDTLSLVTNDQGFNGNDPANSGTGTTEADTDNKTIFVSAVNDAPTVAGDGTESAVDILEDIPSAAGQTVTTLFGGQFSDATDNQSAFGGSSAHTLAGIAVVANGSSGATGQWQYFSGTWTNIGAASLASAQLITAGTAIRFNPASNFHGAAPTLTAHLVDSSGAAFNNLDDVNLSGGGATGGITRYSTATVTLSQNVTPVADVPTVSNATTTVNTQTSSGLVITKNAADGTEVTHFKITNIQNGTLYKNDGATEINSGDFITLAEGADNGGAGLKFTPATNQVSPGTTFSFDVQAAQGATDTNISPVATATITVNKYATTTEITSDLPDPSFQTESVTVNFTVTNNTSGGPTPIGNVQVTASGGGGENCTGVLNGSGTGSCSLVLNTPGNPIVLTASYQGDTLFDTSSDTKNHTVNACLVSTTAVVTKTADDGSSGTLRDAIANACPGATITFDITGAGPHIIQLASALPALSRNVNILNTSGESITVRGEGATDPYRIFSINAGQTVSISNLTITNGSSALGGGILNQGTLTVTGSVITANTGDGGGGIANIADTTNDATLVVNRTTISGNTAVTGDGGGGILNKGSGGRTASATVLESTISGNNSNGTSGGAIASFAITGGSSPLVVTNSTLSGNTAGTNAGGIFASGAVTLTNVTVTNNHADNNNDNIGDGGGLFIDAGPVVLDNTIVAGNFNGSAGNPGTISDDVRGAPDASSSNNLIGVDTGMTGVTNGANGNQVGTAAAPLNPMLGLLANNGGPTQTHLLLPSSTAIDVGDNAKVTNPPFSGPPFTDQRLLARIVDGPDGDTTATVDIGAVEVNYTITATAGTPQSAAVGTAFATALEATVSESGIPIGGVAVTFTAPAAGASGTFAGSGTNTETVSSNGSGVATASTFTANNTAGGYTVSATATGYNGPADFALTNLAATTALTTQVSTATSTVGSPVSDTATLTGGVNPTGTTTFTVFGPNDATCAGAPVFTSAAIPVNGNGNYGSGNFTPTAPGTYRWIATYSGDANNSGIAGACNDANETVTVSTANPTMTTTASAGVAIGGNISDTATIAGGFNPTGSITFRLYGPNDGTCANAPVFTSAAITVNGNGNYGSGNFTPTAPGTYRWIATYSGDSNNAAVAGMCNDANESVIVSQASPTLTTQASGNVTLGGTVSDDATLTGGFNPTGTITFTLYGPNDAFCGNAPVFTSAAISVAGNGTYNSGNFTPTAPGTYRWIATYSGDANNAAVSGMCNDPNESVTVGVNVSVHDASVPEPASGTTNMLFTVILSAPAPAGGASVQYATANGGGTPANGGGACGGAVDYVTVAPTTLSFAAGEQFKTISVTVCSDGTAEPDETFLMNLSSPVNATINDGQATGTITAANPSGTLLISELRTSGPGGAGDDFVEIYNNSNSALTVAATDASAGYGVYKMGADCNATPILIGVIPNGEVIPARGHYLLVGSAYTLGDYGGSGAAAGNLTLSADIETDRNVGLFSTSDVTAISSVNRLDAVGFGLNTGGNCNLLREGSTLPAIGGNATTQHSYFRKMCEWIQGLGCTVPGIPKDTNQNLDDFWLADTAAATGRLGASGPENLTSPVRRDNSGINVVVLDGNVAAAAHANRSRDTTPGASPVTFGTMTLRFRVTNNTGAPVTRLRYRVVDISTAIQPAGPTADLRALTSSLEPTIGPVHDSVTCTAGGGGAPPCTVAVQATTLETPPAQPNGGGYNSTLSSGTITTGSPLSNGQSILINFKLGIEKTGQFRFYIIVEALP